MSLNVYTHTPADVLVKGVAERIQEKKPLMLAGLAQEFNTSELEATIALPGDMRAFAPAETFDDIWKELTSWERATFIMTHLGTVLEIKGVIPSGSHGHGYYNLMGDNPIGGHLKVDDLHAIGFLSVPFMGLESHSVQFFNRDGEVKFSIYAGRENRQLIPTVRDSFLSMRATFCKEQG